MEPTTPSPEVTDETSSSDVVSTGQTDFVGRLTPEEEARLREIRGESQQLLQKVGEHEVLKMRLLQRLDVLDGDGQELINAISRRIGVPPGQQWVALADGSIRVINNSAVREGSGPS